MTRHMISGSISVQMRSIQLAGVLQVGNLLFLQSVRKFYFSLVYKLSFKIYIYILGVISSGDNFNMPFIIFRHSKQVCGLERIPC